MKLHVEKIKKDTPVTKIVFWDKDTIIDEMDIPQYVTIPEVIKIDGELFQRYTKMDVNKGNETKFAFSRVSDVLEIEDYSLEID